ncbi:MAG: MATE family efflux transporter [Lachnospiraceae bacterium]|nr:MATE family efflux transporter [Lachnospiraceae bacterium]
MSITIPILAQTGITSLVNILDNLMVGQTGTEQMTGVSIVNQLIYIYFLCIFGGLSGAGIFTSQYYGKKDDEGIRYTFRYKLWIGIILTLITIILLSIAGEEIINLYMNGDDSGVSISDTMEAALTYLRFMLFGLPAFMLVQVYAGTLRECGEMKLPLIAGVIAVITNLVLDYALIFGRLGLPKLGVAGAAVATVLSRYLECLVAVLGSHRRSKKYTYMQGVYKTWKVPLSLAVEFFSKGSPLLLNETMYSLGIAVLLYCYSYRGITSVAAMNISFSVEEFTNVLMIALGDAVAILVGQLLGAGRLEDAKTTDNRLLFFSIVAGIFAGIVLLISSFFFPELYHTTSMVRSMARHFILIQAFFAPQNTLINSIYYTLRSGGRTLITCLFDGLFLLAVSVPVAYILSKYTYLSVYIILIAVRFVDTIKCLFGLLLVRRGIWIKNMTE